MPSSAKRFLSPDVERQFPKLTRNVYEVKSDETPIINSHLVPAYNCIAFAAGDDKRWWWPDIGGQYYWPVGVPREETVEAFIEMFGSMGYEKCENDSYELGFEKVAIYHTNVGNPSMLPKSPTHAALQHDNGMWKSKIGECEDIEHLNLECLSGEDITGATEPYGEPVQIMKRKRGPT